MLVHKEMGKEPLYTEFAAMEQSEIAQAAYRCLHHSTGTHHVQFLPDTAKQLQFCKVDGADGWEKKVMETDENKANHCSTQRVYH